MKLYLSNIKPALHQVYSSKLNYLVTITFAFIIFSSNSFIRNYKLLFSNPSLKIFFSLVLGTYRSISTPSFVFLVLLSLLAGIVFTMSIFLVRRQIKSSIGVGASGIIIGLLAPACPSCALGLLGIVGLGGFLTFLPFKGLEFGVLGLVILIFSIVYLSKKIVTTVCEIKNV